MYQPSHNSTSLLIKKKENRKQNQKKKEIKCSFASECWMHGEMMVRGLNGEGPQQNSQIALSTLLYASWHWILWLLACCRKFLEGTSIICGSRLCGFGWEDASATVFYSTTKMINTYKTKPLSYWSKIIGHWESDVVFLLHQTPVILKAIKLITPLSSKIKIWSSQHAHHTGTFFNLFIIFVFSLFLQIAKIRKSNKWRHI